MTKTLFVILGPTAVGKTELTLSLAETLNCPILNCDSRQIYRNMKIGTASPTPKQLKRVKHYFVDLLDLDAYYSAAKYEQDVLTLASELFKTHNALIMSGGSMMYIDAVCNGIDDIPTIDEEVRTTLNERIKTEGLDPLLAELKLVDPKHYEVVDKKNTKRIIHALEVYYTTGKPYSCYLTRNTLRSTKPDCQQIKRPFRIIKIGLERPREELFERINSRVDSMINSGLLHEAMTLFPYRDKNSLNTVGYKEMFKVLDGTWELPMATERLKKNTRVYAKKQISWFKRDKNITWFHPNQIKEIEKYIFYMLKH